MHVAHGSSTRSVNVLPYRWRATAAPASSDTPDAIQEARIDVKPRTASCCCGDLTITVSGEPRYVHRCHCDYCQKRTGSVFQVSCWYLDDQILARTGDPQVFEAHPDLEESFAQSGIGLPPNPVIDYTFCKRCGSTVYWRIPLPPGVFGPSEVGVTAVAVGCFVDPDFPPPTEDHYVRNRHHWVEALEAGESYDELPPAEPMARKLT